jgi:hypothetical protein
VKIVWDLSGVNTFGDGSLHVWYSGWVVDGCLLGTTGGEMLTHMKEVSRSCSSTRSSSCVHLKSEELDMVE